MSDAIRDSEGQGRGEPQERGKDASVHSLGDEIPEPGSPISDQDLQDLLGVHKELDTVEVDDLRQVIQQSCAPTDDPGALCTGYVVLAKFAGTTGAEWLTVRKESVLDHWTAKGMLHDALYVAPTVEGF